MAQHALSNIVEVDPEGTTYITCTCGDWRRVYAKGFLPDVTEVESEHEEHRQRAGAEDLKTAAEPATGLDALVAATRAAADHMKAVGDLAAVVDGFIQAFKYAHEQATENSCGVLVERNPDGSVTCTPRMFIDAGSVLFVDSPSITDQPPALHLVHEPVKPAVPDWVDVAKALNPGHGHAQSYPFVVTAHNTTNAA